MGASKRMDKPLFCRYESHEWKTIELEVFNTFVACRTLPQICIRSDLLQVWRSPMEHYHIERQADALTAISVSQPLRHNNSSSSSNLTPNIPFISHQLLPAPSREIPSAQNQFSTTGHTSYTAVSNKQTHFNYSDHCHKPVE